MASERLRRRLGRWLRPLLPGWPDEGRRIVQAPHLGALAAQALAAGPPPRRVLNAGAGEGLFSSLLLGLPGVERVVELDLSYARHRRTPADPRQRIVAGSLTDLPLGGGAFDLILCSEVLEHIPDDGRACDELARVLAPTGRLLVTVPTPPAVPDPAHVREGYPQEVLEALLAARGLAVLGRRFAMRGAFKLLLSRWRPGRVPRLAIQGLAWLDRLLAIGRPQDLLVLASRPPAGPRGA
jgi:SAM-dependent methyltransferase